jgi:bifunctional non-homologous end joining protein LigD
MPGKLSTYHAKRNFGVTPEPRGRVVAPQEELRFVIQKHHARKLHYDFRLEFDGTLKSWAVPRGPSLDPKDKRLAVHVEDHPLDYIDFEGDIPEAQYGAGHVEVWDIGTWEPDGDPSEAYRQGKIKFRLHGKKLQGGWNLVRTRLQASSDKEQWLLIKERDDEARAASDFDVTEALPHSVLQDRDVNESAPRSRAAPAKAQARKATIKAAQTEKKSRARKSPMPEMVSPQLATLVDAIPEEGDWVYEVKYDGYRVLARVEGKKVQLLTRDGKDWTERLPRQARAIADLGLKSGWLDGEIVVLDEHGVPSFQQLQQSFDEHMSGRIVYFAFDLLYCDGADLREWPLSERRARLEQLLHKSSEEVLRYSATLDQPPQQLLEGACGLAMEGIIGKRADSIYSGKRSTDWIKLKCRRRQEFVIAGYTDPQGARQYFGALLLGVYDEDGKLHYAGRVGTGFDRTVLHATHEKLHRLEQDSHPFGKRPSGVTARGVHWVKPQLVAEVSFTEWTQGDILRHAVFHGLRLDKRPREIRREEATSMAVINGAKKSQSSSARTQEAKGRKAASGPAKKDGAGNDDIAGVRITHPDRIIDPSSGLSKRAMAQYYADIAPWLLPWMKDRPAYLLRCPEGIQGQQFFQKHSGRMEIPGIRLLDPSLDPDHPPLMNVGTAQALVGTAQMGTIELHIPGATVDRFDRPDYMVFDLDPDPDLPWKRIVEAAQLTRVLLEELGLRCFLKTSGGRGLHIVAPLARRHAWADVTAFSEAVARHLAETVPKVFSAKMGAQNRQKKVFIDYLRNQPKASTVAPYAARARPNLPVSMPIDWDELPTLRSAADWTIETAVQRLNSLRQDPWADFDSTRQTLTAAMKRKLGLS